MFGGRNWRAAVLALVVLAGWCGASLGQPGAETAREGHATARHRFQDAELWAQRFEDPSRDAWQQPDSILNVLLDRDDLIVADIGSATGYFPVRFARRLPRGLVVGADVEPDMVFYLNDRARQEGLTNLVSVLASPEDPHLPSSVDLVFLCNTVHHIEDRVAYFKRLQRQLRPNGRVAIVDFRVGSRRGPPKKLPKSQLVDEMERAGYVVVEDYPFLPEQYFVVFTLAASRP